MIELGQNGLEAAFGLDPLEDAAQRAAYAALAIQRAGTRAHEKSRQAPVSRIALHADRYLIGRMGTSTQIDQEAKQAASALLARLVAAAPPDGAMVSQTLVQLLHRRFEFEGPVAAGERRHGLSTPRPGRPAGVVRPADELLRRSRTRDRAAARTAGASPRQGHGQIVGIVGDPGVGKSRLVWEFLHGGTGSPRPGPGDGLGRPRPAHAVSGNHRAAAGVLRSGGGGVR